VGKNAGNTSPGSIFKSAQAIVLKPVQPIFSFWHPRSASGCLFFAYQGSQQKIKSILRNLFGILFVARLKNTK
jgi:hypothetical protein